MKKNRLVSLILSTILSFVVFSSSSCASNGGATTTTDDTVVVELETDNYVRTDSANPQKIKKGENASFKLSFVKDYYFVSSSAGEYENGILLVKNVQFSQTIHIDCIEMFSVTLNVNDSHYRVTSENPILVKKGEDAHFDVEIDEDYKFDLPQGCKYENGQLCFSDIEKTSTFSVSTILKTLFRLEIINDDSLGQVLLQPQKTYYEQGESVTITVTPKNDNRFICFSKNKEIHYKNNSESPFSFKSNLELTIEDDLLLYVNYHQNSDFLMEYDLNGGLTFEGETTLMFDYRLYGKRIRPNSLMNDSYFIRDGYYLESYNTSIDGSGQRIGVGSRIDTNLFTNKFIKLYCQWIKENSASEFEYSVNDECIAITNYLGNGTNVVVPRKIGNKFVETISSDSFTNITNLQKVFIPDCVKRIEPSAFKNCDNLTELHYWNSLETIGDNSFVNCDNLSKIAINCSAYPKYLQSFGRGNFADKLDWAEQLADNGRALLGIGSSTLQYNHNFGAMEEAFEHQFSCYNLACLNTMPLQILYDFALQLAGNDDLILIQLHETQASRIAPIYVNLFAYLEGDFDRFLMLNYQNHKLYFLSSWAKYKEESSEKECQKSYEYFDWSLKNYGDYDWSWEGEITDGNKGPGTLTISSLYTYQNFAYLNDLSNIHNFKNTFLGFDTYNKNAVESTDSFIAFENCIRGLLNSNFSVIGNITDSIIEGKYFRYDDNIHLNYEGGYNHSVYFANKIKQMLSE